MIDRLRRSLTGLPEEVWFFLRISAYAIFIGLVYWFLTYESAGTVLLLGFGIAAGFGTLILGAGARGRSARTGGRSESAVADAASPDQVPGAGPADLAPDGPFGDERGRLPGASIAPFVLAVGAAFGGLGLVFGPWLLLVGLAIGITAALDWGRSVSAEYRAVAGDSAAGAAPAGGSGAKSEIRERPAVDEAR